MKSKLKKVKKAISETWNEKNLKMTKRDYIVLGIIITFYSILSFVNLGSFKNPQTFYTFNKDESVIFKLNSEDDVIKMKFFNGRINGDYYLYTSLDGINYEYIKDLNGKGAFAWNEEKVLKKAQYIKILAKTDNSNIGGVSFYNNSKNMISIKNTTSSVVNKDKKTKTLTDEKEMIADEISYLNTTYFDEIYFPRSAYEYIHGLPIYEWTHPPLGKLIQAIPIKIFNTMAPFYYRLMGNIAGILMILVMYIFAKRMFKERKYAIFASLLMTFDNFHFAQTRMGTVDSFLVLFIMLSFYYMYRYFQTNKENSYLFLSGLFFGLSCCIKWTGLYAGLGLCIIFFIYIIKKKLINIKLLLKCIVFYVIIPLTIYTTTFLAFPNIETNNTSILGGVVEQQIDMYNYHANLKATHNFSSKWYTWPISYKPVWYYVNIADDNNKGTISGIGNISIWWMGIIAFIYILVNLIRKKDKEILLLIIACLSLFLPYAFISRAMFLYHYFPVLPFLMLAITLMFKELNKKIKSDIVMQCYIIIFIINFAIYYPVVSGIVVPNTYIDSLKIYNIWIFN